MLRLPFILATALALAPASSAIAWTHGGATGGGSVSAACPYGSGLGDGCPGASATAATQNPGLFGTFPQNGQTYQTASFTGSVSGTTLTVSGVTGTINPNGHQDTLCPSGATCVGIPLGTTIVSGSGSTWTLSANLGTVSSEAMTTQFRPPWNVAGVEYPVGAPSSGLTDPSTLNTCSGTTFPLCLMAGHTNIVEIVAPTSGSDVAIDRYDFSLHGGYNLLLNIAVTGNFSLTNSKFAAGSAFQSGGDVYSFYGGCSSVMSDANSRSDTISGTTTITGNDFNGEADTGSDVENCPASGAVFNVWPSSPSNPVIVEYNYFHDYNPRIQFGYGATIKYNLFSNNNYNTANHGELTAFNESCGALTGCTGISTIDLEHNLVTQGAAYCGGQTAPIFLGSGLISSQTTDVTDKNNVFLNNGCGMTSVSASSPSFSPCTGTSADGANCQITFTTVDGVAGNNTFQLRGGDICTTAGTASGYISCPALLGAQLSGTTGGSGTYRYSSGVAIGSATSMWLAVTSSPSIFMTGETYRNIDSENNYVDGTGVGNFAVEPQAIGDCGINTTGEVRFPPSGQITSTGNWWMTGTLYNGGPNESYGAFSFTQCLNYAEGLFNPGTTSGTTLSATSPVTFTMSQSAQDMTVSAVSSGTLSAGLTVTDGGVNIVAGSQINKQNAATPQQAAFTATAGSGGNCSTTVTVSAVSSGTLRNGDYVYDTGFSVPIGTTIVSGGTGTTGTYVFSNCVLLSSESLTSSATAPGSTGDYTLSSSETVSSETAYAGSFYGTINGHAFFDTAAGTRTDTLFATGVTPGTIDFSSCTPTNCTLSSSPGTLSARNFSALVPTPGGAACPFGVSADGCTSGQTESKSGLVTTGPPTANANTIQHTNFFSSYATQSGQTYGNSGGSSCSNTNCHPPWNVAGVDYPVGVHSGITLKDPTTATLPAGCSYHNAVPSGPILGGAGGPVNVVDCEGHDSYDIEQFNFASTAQGCVTLFIGSDGSGGNGTGTVTIQDNVFGNTGVNQCWTGKGDGGWGNFGVDVDVAGGHFATINYSYNYMTGDGTDPSANTNANAAFCVILINGHTINITYNAIYQCPAEMIHPLPDQAGTVNYLYNYTEGVYCDNTYHCHHLNIESRAPGGGTGTMSAVNLGYNTDMIDHGDFGGTAAFWLDAVDNSILLTTLNEYNNSMVANDLAQGSQSLCGGNCLTNGLLLTETTAITTANFTNNYFDPTSYNHVLSANQLGSCITQQTYLIYTANTSNGSATLTNVSSFNGVYVGMPITGTGIQSSTVVQTINSGTNIIMSKTATANGTGVAVQFGPTTTFNLSGNVALTNGKTLNSMQFDGIDVWSTSGVAGSPC